MPAPDLLHTFRPCKERFDGIRQSAGPALANVPGAGRPILRGVPSDAPRGNSAEQAMELRTARLILTPL